VPGATERNSENLCPLALFREIPSCSVSCGVRCSPQDRPTVRSPLYRCQRSPFRDWRHERVQPWVDSHSSRKFEPPPAKIALPLSYDGSATSKCFRLTLPEIAARRVRLVERVRIRGFGITTGVPRCGNSENGCPLQEEKNGCPAKRAAMNSENAAKKLLLARLPQHEFNGVAQLFVMLP